MKTYNGKVENSLWHCSKGICVGCNYTSYGHDCMRQLLKDVYQEHISDERMIEQQRIKIVAQQAEIEELTEKLEASGDPLETAQYEIMELKEENQELHKICERAIKTYKETKAEAIKEFAEKFENALADKDYIYIEEEHESFISVNKVGELCDTIYKEMTEQKE